MRKSLNPENMLTRGEGAQILKKIIDFIFSPKVK